MAITLARNCKATITGIYSIYAPPHSEFRGVGSVEKSLNVQVKKFMEEAKTMAAKNGIVFNEKMLEVKLDIISSILLTEKSNFDMIVMVHAEEVPLKKCSLAVFQIMSYIHQRSQL
jgi:hypothetical protein